MVGSLEFIKSETLSGSVANVSVTDVFSDKYDVYKITMNNFSTASSTATETFLRFINSSGSVISTDYDYATLYMRTDGSFDQIRSSVVSTTEIRYAMGTIDDSPQGGSAVHYIFNPFSTSSYTFNKSQSSSFYSLPRTVGNKGIGVLKSTASITGFQIVFDVSNANAGTISVYGVK
jgi:hypothetical protein